MSLYNEPIDVRKTTSGHPALFTWRGQMYRVRRIIETWEYTGGDTAGAAGGRTRLVRVAAESDRGDPSIAEITVGPAENHGTMRRLWN